MDYACGMLEKKPLEDMIDASNIPDAYWSGVGGDVQNYYDIRSKFIEGFLSDSDFYYTADEKGNYHITRK